MNEKYTYRNITEADLDMLYSLPDAQEAIVPIRGCRDSVDFLAELGWSVAIDNETNEHLFCLGVSGGEVNMKYLYFYEKKFCTLTETDGGWEFSIFFCSEGLRKNLDSIKKFVSEALIYGGDFLDGDVDFIAKDRTYTFIESKNKYQW